MVFLNQYTQFLYPLEALCITCLQIFYQESLGVLLQSGDINWGSWGKIGYINRARVQTWEVLHCQRVQLLWGISIQGASPHNLAGCICVETCSLVPALLYWWHVVSPRAPPFLCPYFKISYSSLKRDGLTQNNLTQSCMSMLPK